MVRQRMNCNAPLFSPADYDFIMQRENERPRKKVLDELMNKYTVCNEKNCCDKTLHISVTMHSN